jgi:hypothetical protein
MKLKWFRVLLFSLLGIIAFCTIIIAFQILPFSGLPYTFIGACLGAIVSAIITQVLLSGQTDREEVKECNVKVFEMKSKIFYDYIDELWNVLDKQKITKEKYEELRKFFSTRLMIYLKEEENRTIVNHLVKIGGCIDHTDIEYEYLKKEIFGVINVLSGALNLGGKINIEFDRNLEKPIFPMLFKQAIENELNRAFSGEKEIHVELYEGRFLGANELRTDGGWGGEYFCFDFRRFIGCKLLIGSFSQYCPYGGIYMILFVERNTHAVDKFRYTDEEGIEKSCGFGKYLVGILNEDEEWVELTTSHPSNGEYMKLGELDDLPDGTWLFLDAPDYIEPYRQNYHEVARVMGKRVNYWYKHGRIREKEGKYLTIIDFLEKYAGNKKEN